MSTLYENPMDGGELGMGSMIDELSGVGSMYDEMNGMGDLGKEKVDPQAIADALSKGAKGIANAFRGNSGSEEEVPLSKVLLILGVGYLAYKVLGSNVRE